MKIDPSSIQDDALAKSKRRTPSKKEILVGRLLALAFFSLFAYVCFYFGQLLYYRVDYPIDFVDLRKIPASGPRNPEDRAWETLDHLSKGIELPIRDGDNASLWKQEMMADFVERHRHVLSEFRQWRDDEGIAFGLEAYEGMGLCRRIPEFQPDQPEEDLTEFYDITYHRLAKLLTIKGILDIQSNRETTGSAWLSDSFAICHFLLQNPTNFGLHSVTRIFKSNVDFILKFIPALNWQPQLGDWLPTELTWRSSLCRGVWLRKLSDFRWVDNFLSLRSGLKPAWSTTFRFQHSRINTLRHFSEHYQKIRKATLSGPMDFPEHIPEAGPLSQKINRTGVERIAKTGILELGHFCEVAMAIAVTHEVSPGPKFWTPGPPSRG